MFEPTIKVAVDLPASELGQVLLFCSSDLADEIWAALRTGRERVFLDWLLESELRDLLDALKGSEGLVSVA